MVTPPVVVAEGPELVDVLERTALGAAEALMVGEGFCPPPTVHLIREPPGPAYAGYVATRSFYRGEDAAAAVAALGHLPAAMGAARLVLSWEHNDLGTALELPDASEPAVVVVDADRDGHEVRWHPFDMGFGALSSSGVPTLVPHWQASWREPGGWLPAPVHELLDIWRAGPGPHPLAQIIPAMEQAGYVLRWTQTRS